MRNICQIFVFVPFLFFVMLWSCGKQKSYSASEQIPLPPSLRLEQTDHVQFVSLDSSLARRIGIRTETIQKRIHTMRFPVPAIVEPDPDHYFIVSSPIEGRVIEIAHFEGDSVKKGQVLFRIQSVIFANQLAELMQSEADLKYYHNAYNRLKILARQKITTEKALQKAEAEYLRAVALNQAARAKIRALGIPEEQIPQILDRSSKEPYLPIYAPTSGVITSLHIQQGQPITSEEQLCSVTDFSQLRVAGFISPDELALVSVGDTVEICQKSAASLAIRGTIHSINPSLEPLHKSIVVYVKITPRNNWPLPGQNLRMNIFARTQQPVIAIPLNAVEFEKDNPFVFIKHSPVRYEKRPIRIQRIVGTKVIVASGLTEGETIAINQIFTLKALSRFEEFAEE